jgi:hypothetical protein
MRALLPRAQPNPIVLHVKTGMAVTLTNRDGTWRMADVIHVIGSVRNPKVPRFFQVAYVDTSAINWVKAELVTHILPRC